MDSLDSSISSSADEQDPDHAGAPKRSKSAPRERSGRFKKSWNLPFIVASAKGDKFAYCSLCSRDFSVIHGGRNDAQRHCETLGHQRKFSESQSNSSIRSFVGESSTSHSSKVI